MRLRQGFTLLEMFIVLVMAGITAAIIIPSVSGGLASSNLQRAASVISADLQYAHSLAARRRAPVVVAVDATERVLRVRNIAGDTTFAQRHFKVTSTDAGSGRKIERGGDYPVATMTSSASSIVIMPNGLSTGTITITVGASGKSRLISMTRTGQVRVSAT